MGIFIKKERVSSIVYWDWCFSSEWNFIFFYCTVQPDWSKAVTLKLLYWSTSLFEMWSVWYQHVPFSLMNVSIKRLLPTCFHKKENKLVVSVFSTAYYLLLRLRRQLDWHDWRSLLSRSSSPGSPGMLGSTEKLIFRVFFFQIKEFLQANSLE